jgi:CTP:molybdopterin cytidylyltransferase MocA
MIPILILAAGGSTRMRGKDKLLEDVGGVPLLRRQALRAIKTGHPVFVALPDKPHPRVAAISDLHATQLLIPESSEGMSGTMRGAVAQLPHTGAFMMLLGDLIDIGTADMQAIFAAHIAHPDHLIWRGATTTGKPGHPIIFDGSLRPAFNDLRGDGGGEPLVRPLAQKTHLTRFSDDRARNDLDTPEDWTKWRRQNPT